VPRTRRLPTLCSALRKTVKWGGAVGTVVLVVVWVGSPWISIWCHGPSGLYVEVDDARIGLGRDDARPLSPWLQKPVVGWHSPKSIDWLTHRARGRPGWYAQLPLWALTLSTLALTIFAWHRDAATRRRLRWGFCLCGYNRAGLAAGVVCPECGAPATPAAPPA